MVSGSYSPASIILSISGMTLATFINGIIANSSIFDIPKLDDKNSRISFLRFGFSIKTASKSSQKLLLL